MDSSCWNDFVSLFFVAQGGNLKINWEGLYEFSLSSSLFVCIVLRFIFIETCIRCRFVNQHGIKNWSLELELSHGSLVASSMDSLWNLVINLTLYVLPDFFKIYLGIYNTHKIEMNGGCSINTWLQRPSIVSCHFDVCPNLSSGIYVGFWPGGLFLHFESLELPVLLWTVHNLPVQSKTEPFRYFLPQTLKVV